MVKICDARCGSGKTEATIQYINSHPKKKFLYVTPYLPEAQRICKGCPNANFVEPKNDLYWCEFKKSFHLMKLVEQGVNIASTHQGMLYYTPETVKLLRDKGYTLIIDESINVMQELSTNNKISVTDEDIKMLIGQGYIRTIDTGEYEATNKEYPGGAFDRLIKMLRTKRIVQLENHKKTKKNEFSYYLLFSSEIFKEVKEVIVLTYLFKKSEMDLFLQMSGVKYEMIGVERTKDGFQYTKCEQRPTLFDKSLKDLIHIETDKKLNAIGDDRGSLSINWYKKHKEDVQGIKLKKNIYNYFCNRMRNHPSAERLCGTFKNYWGMLRQKGYYNSDLVFNQKSSNEYRHKRVLVYPVNIFPNVSIINYYRSKGLEFNSDHYALSIMIQWIWRSAIRDGKEIWVYIPSKRMRNLLQDWLKSFDMEYKL